MIAPDVSVVIVSYNTRALLQACLETLQASIGLAIETFVVDNGSLDGSADLVAAQFPTVTLIRNPQNRGFAAANNLAIPRTRGRHVLLLNPDTRVNPDTVATLAAFLDAHPDVAITGPRVLNEDGTLQSCGYWYPTPLEEIRGSRQVERLARRLLGDPRGLPNPDQETDVDWIDGCCLLIRQAVIARIGLLDEQYFLYAEELDWCRSARAAGWRIVTCPRAEMLHLRGRSSDQVHSAALALLIETRLRYYHKHDGLPTAMLAAAAYAVGDLCRWRREPVKSRARLRGVRQWWRAARGREAGGVPALSAAGALAGRSRGA